VKGRNNLDSPFTTISTIVEFFPTKVSDAALTANAPKSDVTECKYDTRSDLLYFFKKKGTTAFNFFEGRFPVVSGIALDGVRDIQVSSM
jgi:hypothetical protein